MSQSRHADWLLINERIRRLCIEAFATYDEAQQVSHRWGAWERFDTPTAGKTEDEILESPTREVEALYCRAATGEELLIKYAFMKSEQRAGRVPPTVVFRDRTGAGFGSREPDEPAEWKAYRARWAAHRDASIAAGASHAQESGERTREQLRATVRNWMALQRLSPTTRELRALGIGRAAENWKGR